MKKYTSTFKLAIVITTLLFILGAMAFNLELLNTSVVLLVVSFIFLMRIFKMPDEEKYLED